MQSQNKDPMMFVIAVIAAQIIGVLVTQMSPLVVGGVKIGLDLTEQQAGYVVFAEFMVLSVTVIIIAPFLSKFSYRSLCFSAAGVAVGAQFTSILLPNLVLFVTARCLAGIGEGMVYAVSLAVVASHSVNPDKLYSYIQVVWALSSIVLFALGGNLIELYGHQGIYGMIAVISIFLVVFLHWLPNNIKVVQMQGQLDVDTHTIRPLMGMLTLTGIFLYLVATAAIYTFTAPLGERSGLNATQIGYALTLGSIVGVSGAGLAAWLNIRKGRLIPITTFSFAISFLALVLCTNTHPVVYVIALTLVAVFFYFSVPYLFGLAAALNKQGRWAAAAGSAYLLGFAVGPAFAGTMIEFFGYKGFGVASAITAMVGWLLLSAVVRNLKMVAASQ